MNYVIIGIITSGLFIISEIIIVPLIFFLMVFINKVKILSKKKFFTQFFL